LSQHVQAGDLYTVILAASAMRPGFARNAKTPVNNTNVPAIINKCQYLNLVIDALINFIYALCYALSMLKDLIYINKLPAVTGKFTQVNQQNPFYVHISAFILIINFDRHRNRKL